MIDAQIASIRTEYIQSALDENSADTDAIAQFSKWWQACLSAEISEPNAFVISSVDSNLQVHSRIVLLKSFDENGFIFFTNYNSNKGQEFAQNNKVAMLFFWKELERQVRIEGSIEKIDAAYSKAYFYSRPRESQIGAWTSQQSQEVENRTILEDKFVALSKQFENQEVPYPEHWGGYIVKASSIEFWQGRASRLHDRLKYTRSEEGWQLTRLQP